MRRLLLLALLAMPAFAACTSPCTFAVSASAASQGAAVSVTADSTGSDLIFVEVAHYAMSQSGAATIGITDGKGNTWSNTPAFPGVSSNFIQSDVYWANPPVSKRGTSHTITISVTGSFGLVGLAVAGFAGFTTAETGCSGYCPNAVQGAGTTFMEPNGGFQPLGNGRLMVFGLAAEEPSATLTVASPLAMATYVPLSGAITAFGAGIAYYVQPTATLQGATWTFSGAQTNSITSYGSFIVGTTGGGSATARHREL